MANPTLQSVIGNTATVASGANLNALASGSLVLGAAFSNVIGDGAGQGFVRAIAQLHIDSMTVSAGGVVDGWFLVAPDGSTYEQGGASVTPQRPPDFSFQPVAQTAAVDLDQLVSVPNCATIKCLTRNNALGASMPANNNAYLKLVYQTDSYPSL